MTTAEAAQPAFARWERNLLLALCGLALLYWVIHYHPYVLPSSDFNSFEITAGKIWSGEELNDFKRMPLFPFLAGGLAHLIPVERPILHAALVLNLGLSVGILVLTYLLGRRFIGPLAFLPAASLLFMRTFHQGTLNPLVEPLLAFLILLALLLFMRGSRWQYLVAGLAAIARYEASALIAIFFVLNSLEDRKYWFHLGLSALASMPFLIWMGLSVLSHSGGNPYLEQMSDQQFALSLDVVESLIRQLGDDMSFWLLFAFAPYGVYLSFQQPHRKWSIAILSFIVLYAIAHMAFGVDKHIYAYPVLWVTPLYIAIGILGVFQQLKQRLPAKYTDWTTRPFVVPGGIALCGLATLALLWILLASPGLKHPAVYVLFALVIWALVVYLGTFVLPLTRRFKVLGSCVLATGFFAFCHDGLEVDLYALSRYYYTKYSAAVATKWLAEHLQEEEQALIFNRVALPQTTLQEEQTVLFGHIKAMTHEELVPEIRQRGIDYVVYWYRAPKPSQEKKDKNYERDLYYYNRFKVWLADPFRQGNPVEGFELVTTIELPEAVEKPDVQIYRVLGEDPQSPR